MADTYSYLTGAIDFEPIGRPTSTCVSSARSTTRWTTSRRSTS